MIATGAWAPRRESSTVYARRRLAIITVLALLVGTPLFLATRSSGSGSGEKSLVPTEAETAEPESCRQAVDLLSLRSRLALLLMVGLDGDNLLLAEALLSGTDRPGGIFVQSGTAVWSDELFKTKREDLLPQIVAVDDEGGRVQPLAGVLDDIPSAASLTEVSAGDVEAAAAKRGEQLNDIGVDVVFAPVADVGGGAGIGDRSFSDDPAVVASYAGAYARGLRSSGVLPVLKHFPGHGRASGDSHNAPAATPTLAELRQLDLVPYEELLTELPVGVMIGHLDVPGFTENGVPASLSPAVVGLLRGSYEYDGITFTDDLVAMQAVTDRFSVPEAVERALIAGIDMPLLARDTDIGAVLDQLTDAVQTGRLTETRVAAALDRIVEASGCEDRAN